MADLGEGVDETTDETDEDGGAAAKGDGRIEEHETAERDGQLVQSTDHGVGCRRGDTDGPGGCVGDEDCGKTGDDHDHDDGVALFDGEVLCDVGGGPVFDEDGGDEQDWDGEEVVVVHGWLKLAIAPFGSGVG